MDDSKLKPRLRKLMSALAGDLKKINVHEVARSMLSDSGLTPTEVDKVTSHQASYDAACELLDLTYARGDNCIISLAKALRTIGMDKFANELDPAATASLQAQPTSVPLHATHDVQTASHYQPTATGLQSARDGVSSIATPLYVAVQLRLSPRGRYLEVQVLVNSSKQVLQKWQQSVNQKKADQHHMPEPELVTLPGFSVDQPVAVTLSSTTNGEATVYRHGCRKASFFRQSNDSSTPNTHAWLFDLAENRSYATRRYFLHVHKSMRASSDDTQRNEILSEAICKALNIIPDDQERCLISQLGFTEENVPLQKGASGAQNFGRHAQPGEVVAVRTLVDMTRYYQSITKLAQSVGWIDGPVLSGTGFCVGNNKQKYFMTCRHVIANTLQVIPHEMFNISFKDLESGKESSVRGYCVVEDVLLDYAILKLEDADQAPQPIPCGSINIAELAGDSHYLTIIGYSGELVVDRAVELQTISKDQVQWVKNYVTASYLHIESSIDYKQRIDHQQLKNYVEQYDGIISEQEYSVFYNVAQHKQGSSGSPALLFSPDGSVVLVALHRGGYPKFYYDDNPQSLLREVIPINYTVEVGTRLSAISLNVCARSKHVWQDVFNIRNQP